MSFSAFLVPPGRIRPAVSVAVVSLFLLACGGGGGSDTSQNSSSSNPTPAPDPTPTPAPAPTSGWSSATRIGNVRDFWYYELYSPQLALNDAGRAVAVWQENTDSGDQVWANTYRDGNWGTPLSIGLTQSSGPQIATNADGNAIAIWDEAGVDGVGITSRTIRVAHYDGNAWAAPVQISDSPATDYEFYAFSPQIALADDGTAIAVWLQDDPDAATVRSVWSARYDGNSWSTPALVSNGDRSCNQPQLAMDGSGNAIVAWSQDTNAFDPGQPAGNSIPNVWTRRYRSGSWGTAQQLGSSDLSVNESGSNIQLAVTATGDGVAVWQEWRTTGSSVMASRYDTTSDTWTTPAPLQTDTSSSAGADVAIDPNGNAFAVWQRYDGTRDNGWAARYNATNGTWTAPERFEDSDTDLSVLPRVDMDGSGNAVVVWGQAGLRARRYLAGSGWETDSPIGSNMAFGAFTMDTNAAGQTIVVELRTTYATTTFTYAPWAMLFTP